MKRLFQKRRRTEAEKIRERVLRRRRQADYNARRRASFYTGELEDVSRDEIAERDNHLCHICGLFCSVHDLTLDHVVPLSKGGAHTKENIRIAHRECNSRKGNK